MQHQATAAPLRVLWIDPTGELVELRRAIDAGDLDSVEATDGAAALTLAASSRPAVVVAAGTPAGLAALLALRRGRHAAPALLAVRRPDLAAWSAIRDGLASGLIAAPWDRREILALLRSLAGG